MVREGEKLRYHQYSEYDKVPSGLKKLDFIVQSAKEYQWKKIKNESSINILDVGCGNGNISIPLASLGYKVVGIDVDQASVKHARNKNPFPNAVFKIADAERTVFKEKFDVIICSEIFEHLLKPARLMQRVNEILDKKGILIITIPNEYGPFEFMKHLGKIFKKLGLSAILKILKCRYTKRSISHNIQTSNIDSPHVQFYTMKEFKRLLKDNSFFLIKVKHSDFLMGLVHYYLKLNVPTTFWDLDCKIADKLPHFMVSGWYFICKHE